MQRSLLSIAFATLLAMGIWTGCSKNQEVKYVAYATPHAPLFSIRPASNSTGMALNLESSGTIDVKPCDVSILQSQIWGVGIEMFNNVPQIVITNTNGTQRSYLSHKYDALGGTMTLGVQAQVSDETGWQMCPSAATLPSGIRVFATTPTSSMPVYTYALKLDNSTAILQKIEPTSQWGSTDNSYDWVTVIYP